MEDPYEKYLADNRITTEVRANDTRATGEYVVVFHLDGDRFETPFFYHSPNLHGRGLDGWCLHAMAQDCATLDAARDDFRRWCDELGFDPDENKPKEDFKAVVAQRDSLAAFLGDDLLETLVYGMA